MEENGALTVNGKGDKRRPEDRAKIAANWDKAFGKKNVKSVTKKETKNEHKS